MSAPPVDGRTWRSDCAAAVDEGLRFATLYATRTEGVPVVRAVFTTGAQVRVLSAEAAGDELPTLVDLVPAAVWDEREAHDLYGVRFAGHHPLRPLIHHDADLTAWTVPVDGDGPHQVAVGPIHAGVIESGHFRFHVVGERILHLDVRLFYNHRGLEPAAEGSSLPDGLAFAQRACAAGNVANSVAYAQAAEMALGLEPNRELAVIRTVLLELERVYNHLGDIGAVCAGIGFAPGAMAFAALKERAHRLNARIGGHRFLFGTIGVGHSPLRIPAETAAAARSELAGLRTAARRTWREVLFNTAAQARFRGVGVLDAPAALRLGTVGPAVRAAGVDRDQRSHSPRLAYESFKPAAAPEPTGDVAARVEIRAVELDASFGILDGLLAHDLHEATADPRKSPNPIGVGIVEGPRGETVCVIEALGETLGRLHLRTASYANWPAVVHAATGELLPDFPLINKSFELCYACNDR
ncbi:MAG TPA: NADH-quinone oxidoreductase subunit C [Mycobacteriales bacterium]|nr:NADH-quinone oxidoreductase subunit C [Mycobacteriales bacterium]